MKVPAALWKLQVFPPILMWKQYARRCERSAKSVSGPPVRFRPGVVPARAELISGTCNWSRADASRGDREILFDSKSVLQLHFRRRAKVVQVPLKHADSVSALK